MYSIQKFLEDEFIKNANEILGFEKPLLEKVMEAAQIIRNNSKLLELLDYYHCKVFKETDKEKKLEWFDLTKEMGDCGRLFNVVLLITEISEVKKFYKEKGIPLSILKDTLADLNLWIQHCKSNFGYYGLNEFNWLVNHFKCRLFRLGRLQFMPGTFNNDINLYKNILNGKVIVLSEDGCVINNGLHTGESIVLPESEWTKLLEKGDNIIEMHIPAGEKMSYEMCTEAISKAREFFQNYFKEYDYKAFTCISWLLDPQLQKILSSDSNIVRFQKSGYLFPILSDDRQTIERVFGGSLENLPERKNMTSLQKGILEYMDKGNKMKSGGLIVI